MNTSQEHKRPFVLQLEVDAVVLIELLKIRKANFISFLENQYSPVSYLPAEYPGMREQLKADLLQLPDTSSDILQTTRG